MVMLGIWRDERQGPLTDLASLVDNIVRRRQKQQMNW